MGKVLSIVIPSYNVEKTLSKTVDSIISANDDHRIEIIIVNDGSNDNTLRLAESMQCGQEDDIAIVDKENGGHGSVINCGITVAKGKYFKVIDGDDWVDSNQLKLLVDFMEDCEADVVVNDYTMVRDVSYTKLCEIRYGSKDNIIKKTLSFDQYCNTTEFYTIHAFNIKTEILRNNHIKVSEKVFYEDTQYLLYPVPYVSTLAFSGCNAYMYRVASATQSINPANMMKNRKHRVVVISGLLSYYKEHNALFTREKRIYYMSRVLSAILGQYGIFESFDNIDNQLLSEISDFNKLLADYDEFGIREAINKISFVNTMNSGNLSRIRSSVKKRRYIHKGKMGRIIDKYEKSRVTKAWTMQLS